MQKRIYCTDDKRFCFRYMASIVSLQMSNVTDEHSHVDVKMSA